MPIISESPTNPQAMQNSQTSVNIVKKQQQRKKMNTSTDFKMNVLEQENKELKNQIEMLRAALMGLCQNNP